MTDQCCTGLNGSHTGNCPANQADRLVCWCCGATFPAGWACLWGANGSRCFDCEGHDPACRAHIDQGIEDVRDEAR